MAKVTPQQYVDKWGRRLKSAGTDIQNGVSSVTVAPGKSAAAAQDRMLNNLIESINNGTWAQRVAGVSLEDWQTAMTKVGIPRISAGVDAAMPKQQDMAQKLLTAVDNAKRVSDAMPKGNLQDSIARMTAFVTEMSKSRGKIRA